MNMLRSLFGAARPDPLASARETAAERLAVRSLDGRVRRSRCIADAEIRAFLLESVGRLTIDQACEKARRRFNERAPSRSAIGRFFKTVGDQARVA